MAPFTQLVSMEIMYPRGAESEGFGPATDMLWNDPIRFERQELPVPLLRGEHLHSLSAEVCRLKHYVVVGT